MNLQRDIQKAVRSEARSLLYLADRITPAFAKATRLILNGHGKLIVTGMGKSGLVAQKIAATFSSTGTPAIFLHPAEGLHGDLGIVARQDIVLAIGKSGESEELINLLPSIRRIGAKLIALTSNPASSLAQRAAVVLHMPIDQEICPLNLAPTTSTTAAMVIGDALAVALMKLRGFNKSHFALYHPGGILGKKLLLKVKDVMRSGKQNPMVSVHASFDALLLEITQKSAGAASVIDDRGRLVGLVTDYDLRRLLRKPAELPQVRIRDIMNSKPVFVYAEQMAVEAIGLMEQRKKPITLLPVVNRKRYCVGMIHIHDLVARGLLAPPIDSNR